MHTELLRIKDKLRQLEIKLDRKKDSIFDKQEKLRAEEATYSVFQDELEELKFQILEMELAGCR